MQCGKPPELRRFLVPGRHPGVDGAAARWTDPDLNSWADVRVIVVSRVTTVREARWSTSREQNERVLYSLAGTICTS